MGKKRKKTQADATAPTPRQSRNYQVPGCVVSISSEERGVPVEDLLSLAFNLAHSNPGARVHFGITVESHHG